MQSCNPEKCSPFIRKRTREANVVEEGTEDARRLAHMTKVLGVKDLGFRV